MTVAALTEVLAPRLDRRQITGHLVVFAAAAAGAGAGRAVTTTYVPVLLDRIKDAPGLIGLVMLVNAAAGFAVPLAVGYWSDRRRARGASARLPFIFGGSVLGAGGLAAIALGSSSSYLLLAIFAATVYVGLNAITTTHRALVAELFSAGEQPRATSAQELALLAGGLLGLAAGGALTDLALWAPFAVIAVLLPLLAVPTLIRLEEPRAVVAKPRPRRLLHDYLNATRNAGVRALLVAEVLWVTGYAALPAFFVLYAEHVLDLSAARAALILAAFGVVTAASTFAAGKIRNPDLLRPALLIGVVLMGAGLLSVPLTTNIVLAVPGLVAAAAGFGIVSTTAFPVLAAMIPPGEAGEYTALFFSVRAIASAVALPAAGGLIAATGSYRALFVVGGVVTLAALFPLTQIRRRIGPRSKLLALRVSISLATVFAGLAATALLVEHTPLHRLDETVFRWINGLGPGPRPLFDLLEQPVRNYALLVAFIFIAGVMIDGHWLPRTIALGASSALLAFGLLQAVYAVYDRARPSEVFAPGDIVLAADRNWARIESFPSGHMAIVTALAASTWFMFPRLRRPLIAYVALNAVTRILFGAHFPVDVVAGTALGYASAVTARSLLTSLGRSSSGPEAHPLSALDPKNVWAVMPSHGDVPARSLVAEVQRHLGGLMIVDDGSDERVRRELKAIAGQSGAELIRLTERRGKGAALRAGIAAVREHAPAAEAILVIDADGQHPPAAIPTFLRAASEAEIVIGDRLDDLAAMPWKRRIGNRISRRLLELTTARPARDTQSGMRLLRGRALDLPLVGDGYEAESRHLRAALVNGFGVKWVPIPAIYGDETSGFRPIRDSVRVLGALLRSGEPNRRSSVRSQHRPGFRRRHPTSSAPRDIPAKEPPALQGQKAAA